MHLKPQATTSRLRNIIELYPYYRINMIESILVNSEVPSKTSLSTALYIF
jgi:hypothetical protein